MMDWKLVSAFATGAVLASGIVYFAVKPADVAKVEVAKPAVSKAISPAPTPQIAAVPPSHVARVPHAELHVPVREKPSPMPPVRRQREVVVARHEPPPPTPVPPAPDPPVPEPTVPVQNVSLPAPAPPPKVQVRVPNVVKLAAGMSLAVRIGETISSSRNQPGDSFLATLTQPLVIDGFVIAERGARLEGRVVDAAQAGRGRGASHLAISVVGLATSDGQNIRIRTEPYSKDGPSPATEIPVETRISFRVQDSLTITERLD
jgi:hypothetical protein